MLSARRFLFHFLLLLAIFYSCECYDCPGCSGAIKYPGCNGTVFLKNDSLLVQGSSPSCISVSGAENATFSCLGRNIDSNGSLLAMNISNSKNLTITNCTLWHFRTGILVSNSTDIKISFLNITSNDSVNGIGINSSLSVLNLTENVICNHAYDLYSNDWLNSNLLGGENSCDSTYGGWNEDVYTESCTYICSWETKPPTVTPTYPGNATTLAVFPQVFKAKAVDDSGLSMSCGLIIDGTFRTDTLFYNSITTTFKRKTGIVYKYYAPNIGEHTWRVICKDRSRNKGYSQDWIFYVNESICECDDKESCEASFAVCYYIKLTADVSVQGDYFIGSQTKFRNKTFDCQGHSITGDGTGTAFYLGNKNSNNTIKNCVISNFTNGIYNYIASTLSKKVNESNTNNSFINITVLNTSKAFYFYTYSVGDSPNAPQVFLSASSNSDSFSDIRIRDSTNGFYFYTYAYSNRSYSNSHIFSNIDISNTTNAFSFYTYSADACMTYKPWWCGQSNASSSFHTFLNVNVSKSSNGFYFRTENGGGIPTSYSDSHFFSGINISGTQNGFYFYAKGANSNGVASASGSSFSNVSISGADKAFYFLAAPAGGSSSLNSHFLSYVFISNSNNGVLVNTTTVGTSGTASSNYYQLSHMDIYNTPNAIQFLASSDCQVFHYVNSAYLYSNSHSLSSINIYDSANAILFNNSIGNVNCNYSYSHAGSGFVTYSDSHSLSYINIYNTTNGITFYNSNTNTTTGEAQLGYVYSGSHSFSNIWITNAIKGVYLYARTYNFTAEDAADYGSVYSNGHSLSGIYISNATSGMGVISSNFTLGSSNISNGTVGLNVSNSAAVLSSNVFCFNSAYDVYSNDWLSSSGSNNRCNRFDNWTAEYGSFGCFKTCYTSNPPAITLLYPPNNSNINKFPVPFNFSVSDDDSAQMECGLVLDNKTVRSNMSVNNSTVTTFQYYVEPGNHTWKIECYDADYNKVVSEERRLITVLGTCECDDKQSCNEAVNSAGCGIVTLTTNTTNITGNESLNITLNGSFIVYQQKFYNKTFDCNNTRIIGNGTGTAFYFGNNNSNIVIKNCIISNFTYGIYSYLNATYYSSLAQQNNANNSFLNLDISYTDKAMYFFTYSRSKVEQYGISVYRSASSNSHTFSNINISNSTGGIYFHTYSAAGASSSNSHAFSNINILSPLNGIYFYVSGYYAFNSPVCTVNSSSHRFSNIAITNATNAIYFDVLGNYATNAYSNSHNLSGITISDSANAIYFRIHGDYGAASSRSHTISNVDIRNATNAIYFDTYATGNNYPHPFSNSSSCTLSSIRISNSTNGIWFNTNSTWLGYTISMPPYAYSNSHKLSGVSIINATTGLVFYTYSDQGGAYSDSHNLSAINVTNSSTGILTFAANFTMDSSNISNNTIGINSTNATLNLTKNFICYNNIFDLYSQNWFSSYGFNNTCTMHIKWKDSMQGGGYYQGCANYCPAIANSSLNVTIYSPANNSVHELYYPYSSDLTFNFRAKSDTFPTIAMCMLLINYNPVNQSWNLTNGSTYTFTSSEGYKDGNNSASIRCIDDYYNWNYSEIFFTLGACYCSSKQECNAAVVSPMCYNILLTTDISVNGSFIDYHKEFLNKTFNCQANSVIGNSTGAAFNLNHSNSYNTIKNCVISNFTYGIYSNLTADANSTVNKQSNANNSFINLTISGTEKAMYFIAYAVSKLSGGTVTVYRTASSDSHTFANITISNSTDGIYFATASLNGSSASSSSHKFSNISISSAANAIYFYNFVNGSGYTSTLNSNSHSFSGINISDSNNSIYMDFTGHSGSIYSNSHAFANITISNTVAGISLNYNNTYYYSSYSMQSSSHTFSNITITNATRAISFRKWGSWYSTLNISSCNFSNVRIYNSGDAISFNSSSGRTYSNSHSFSNITIINSTNAMYFYFTGSVGYPFNASSYKFSGISISNASNGIFFYLYGSAPTSPSYSNNHSFSNISISNVSNGIYFYMYITGYWWNPTYLYSNSHSFSNISIANAANAIYFYIYGYGSNNNATAESNFHTFSNIAINNATNGIYINIYGDYGDANPYSTYTQSHRLYSSNHSFFNISISNATNGININPYSVYNLSYSTGHNFTFLNILNSNTGILAVSSNFTLKYSNIMFGYTGINTTNSRINLSNDFVCYNSYYDLYSPNWLSSYGIYNTCLVTTNWKDSTPSTFGYCTACTYICPPFDLSALNVSLLQPLNNSNIVLGYPYAVSFNFTPTSDTFPDIARCMLFVDCLLKNQSYDVPNATQTELLSGDFYHGIREAFVLCHDDYYNVNVSELANFSVGTCYCSSKEQCNAAVVSKTCSNIYLISNISLNGSFIEYHQEFYNKTFDCMGNKVAGNSTGTAFYLGSNNSYNTIKNCRISNFTYGIYSNTSSINTTNFSEYGQGNLHNSFTDLNISSTSKAMYFYVRAEAETSWKIYRYAYSNFHTFANIGIYNSTNGIYFYVYGDGSASADSNSHSFSNISISSATNATYFYVYSHINNFLKPGASANSNSHSFSNITISNSNNSIYFLVQGESLNYPANSNSHSFSNITILNSTNGIYFSSYASCGSSHSDSHNISEINITNSTNGIYFYSYANGYYGSSPCPAYAYSNSHALSNISIVNSTNAVYFYAYGYGSSASASSNSHNLLYLNINNSTYGLGLKNSYNSFMSVLGPCEVSPYFNNFYFNKYSLYLDNSYFTVNCSLMEYNNCTTCSGIYLKSSNLTAYENTVCYNTPYDIFNATVLTQTNGPFANGTYGSESQCTDKNGWNDWNEYGCTYECPIPANTPPNATLILPENGAIFSGMPINISFTATDVDNLFDIDHIPPANNLRVYIYLSNNLSMPGRIYFSRDYVNGTVVDFPYNNTLLMQGNYTLTFYARDLMKAQDTKTVNITIILNTCFCSSCEQCNDMANKTKYPACEVITPLGNITCNGSFIQNLTGQFDCNGTTITGSGSGTGIFANKQALVYNCTIVNFEYGIYSNYSNTSVLYSNFFNNTHGIYLFNNGNSYLFNSTFMGNWRGINSVNSVSVINQNMVCLNYEDLYSNDWLNSTGAKNMCDGVDWNDTGKEGCTLACDFTPPNVTLVTPPDNFITSQPSIELGFYATDNLASSMNCTVEVTDPVYGIMSVNVSAQNYTLAATTFTDLTEGYHYWHVTCSDYAGNNATSETWSFLIDSIKPEVILHSPSNAWITNSTTVAFNFTARDAVAEKMNCTVIVSDAVYGSMIHDVVALNNAPTKFNMSGFDYGYHYWNATCMDYANNTAVSETWHFVIKYPGGAECKYDAQCPAEDCCNGNGTCGTCECSASNGVCNTKCPYDGDCSQVCASDADCPVCKSCLNGMCTENTTLDGFCESILCTKDPDCAGSCAEGEMWINNTCIDCSKNKYCNPDCPTDPDCCEQNWDCPSVEECINSTCLDCSENFECNPLCPDDPDCCATNADCRKGTICVDGSCIAECSKNWWCNPLCCKEWSLNCSLSNGTFVCSYVCPDQTDQDCCNTNIDCGSGCCDRGTCRSCPGEQKMGCLFGSIVSNCLPGKCCTEEGKCGSCNCALDGKCNSRCGHDPDCIPINLTINLTGCAFGNPPCGECHSCVDNSCVSISKDYNFNAPLEALLNSTVKAGVKTVSGVPVPSLDITVVTPSGSRVHKVTDYNGEVFFFASEEGAYGYEFPPCTTSTKVLVTYVYNPASAPTTKTIVIPIYITEPSKIDISVVSFGDPTIATIQGTGPQTISAITSKDGTYSVVLETPGKYTFTVSANNVKSLSAKIELSALPAVRGTGEEPKVILLIILIIMAIFVASVARKRIISLLSKKKMASVRQKPEKPVAGMEVLIFLTDENGEAVKNSFISIISEKGESTDTKTDGKGKVIFIPPKPGTYIIASKEVIIENDRINILG